MEDKSHNMEYIIFSKTNLLNASSYLLLFCLNAFHQVSNIASELVPVVTVLGGSVLLAFNSVKLYKELFNKSSK